MDERCADATPSPDRPSSPGEVGAREIHVAGTRLLVALKTDTLAIAKALKRRDVVALHGAAEIAWRSPDPKMAATDPALYKALRDGATAYFLKGYAILDRQRLKEAAQKALSRSKE